MIQECELMTGAKLLAIIIIRSSAFTLLFNTLKSDNRCQLLDNDRVFVLNYRLQRCRMRLPWGSCT